MQDNTDITMYEACLLHARADRALRSLVGLKLEQYKMTMMEWLLLGVVCGGPPEGLSMSSVAQALDVTLPQVTALANKLLNLKVVKQKTQPHDRRSRFIKPTPKGQAMLEDIEQTLSVALKQWLADVPKEQLNQYMETVRWLATHRHPQLGGQAPDTPPASV